MKTILCQIKNKPFAGTFYLEENKFTEIKSSTSIYNLGDTVEFLRNFHFLSKDLIQIPLADYACPTCYATRDNLSECLHPVRRLIKPTDGFKVLDLNTYPVLESDLMEIVENPSWVFHRLSSEQLQRFSIEVTNCKAKESLDPDYVWLYKSRGNTFAERVALTVEYDSFRESYVISKSPEYAKHISTVKDSYGEWRPYSVGCNRAFFFESVNGSQVFFLWAKGNYFDAFIKYPDGRDPEERCFYHKVLDKILK